MIPIKGQNENEIGKLYQEFVKKYKHLYCHEDWEFIEENFWTFIFGDCAPDILMQVYSEIGIEPACGSFYNKHLKNLMSNFDIRCKVFDVASGMIPSFANNLALEQLRLGKGTVTLYEPLLLTTKPKHPNMKLHMKKFTRETHIKEFDLITGIMPCGATETIIEQACRNGKDFYIAMCGCTHFEQIPWGMYVTSEMYQDYIIEKAESLLKEHDNGTLVVERFEDSYEIDYPILYNRKK